MSWTYGCPKCKSVVNPDETIVLIVSGGEQQIMVGFHPQPGNYTIYSPHGVEMKLGRRYEFYCPLCRQNLASLEHENLSKLELWEGESRHSVLFSNIAGERATYVVKDSDIADQHGDHSETYRNDL